MSVFPMCKVPQLLKAGMIGAKSRRTWQDFYWFTGWGLGRSGNAFD
jgi:hypothetical protein